jgi:hypothetical protein
LILFSHLPSFEVFASRRRKAKKHFGGEFLTFVFLCPFFKPIFNPIIETCELRNEIINLYPNYNHIVFPLIPRSQLRGLSYRSAKRKDRRIENLIREVWEESPEKIVNLGMKLGMKLGPRGMKLGQKLKIG